MSAIQKIKWSCSEYDCYTILVPISLNEVDEDMDCLVPGGLLMEVRRILRDLVSQSRLPRNITAYGPCTIDAQALLTQLNDNNADASGRRDQAAFAAPDCCDLTQEKGDGHGNV